MAKILLAHGILGFGSVFPSQSINYFNKISDLYVDHGHDVLCPTVPALGSLQARAEALETQILDRWGNDREPIFALAHSMGGLDCRRVIARSERLAGRFRRLVTIATPHFGSPVSNAVLSAPVLPGFLSFNWLLNLFKDDAGALRDLQIRRTLQDPDVPNVEYLCIGCDASNTNPRSPLFTVTELVGALSHSPNDGVVSLDSASKTNDRATLWKEWPVDHGGAIGWPSGGSGLELVEALKHAPIGHIERFRSLLPSLIA
ncbi:alpha/beta fold hydrolase [Nitrosomonas sp.]|uniref:lipase family alpha/beta hydrolase n=1 Tax=Nitrosomonas sp. TaxID=42353 RepID=UPI0025D02586|nr:alpha/beta fold hydrolase [Nitrosomonas sp.]MBV6448474.1 hypothetical protein [Nitrosomonas sp.]